MSLDSQRGYFLKFCIHLALPKEIRTKSIINQKLWLKNYNYDYVFPTYKFWLLIDFVLIYLLEPDVRKILNNNKSVSDNVLSF